MKAAVLVKNGKADEAFEIREVAKPEPKAGEALIKVEAFGLNFADVMARLGLYEDCPPLPAIIGYDIVGEVVALGDGVEHLAVGDRVAAMTRFGGYAEFAVTDAWAAVKVPADMAPGVATALSVQYGTAYYSAEIAGRMFPGDHVLIHAAAGGVGTALVQMAKRRGCTIYGTAGSDEKLDYLREMGVHHPINYRKVAFQDEIKKLRGEQGVDVIYDSIGGDYVKKGIKLLNKGGRIVMFGAAKRAGKSGLLNTLSFALGFGFFSPITLIMHSRSIIGVNMLRIADHRPDVLKVCLEEVAALVASGELAPKVGGEYHVDQLADAHAFLESRKSTGKIVVKWNGD